MQNSWNLLLDKLGIAKSYTDAAQNRKEYVADDETLLKMVNYLGFKLNKIEDSDKLLAKLEKENDACARMAAAQAAASDFGALCRRVPGPMGGVYRQKIIFLTN